MISANAAGGQGNPIFDMILMFGVIGIIFYFLILRPQRREQAERQKMLNALAKGDRVVTAAGIHGRVVDIHKNGELVTVECGKNVQLDFSRSAIAQIAKKGKEEGGAEDGAAEKSDEKPASGKKEKKG